MSKYSSNLIILDSPVAAGILSGIEKNSQKSRKWLKLATNIAKGISNGEITIPTPVFYEIAQTNKHWYKLIEFIKNSPESRKSSLFKYAQYSITPHVLIEASRYKYRCCNAQSKDKGDFKKQKQKISTYDAIIAGYCLKYGYLLLTTNQKDFPEKYFKLLKVVESVRKNALEAREFVYLLEPKLNEWHEE